MPLRWSENTIDSKRDIDNRTDKFRNQSQLTILTTTLQGFAANELIVLDKLSSTDDDICQHCIKSN